MTAIQVEEELAHQQPIVGALPINSCADIIALNDPTGTRGFGVESKWGSTKLSVRVEEAHGSASVEGEGVLAHEMVGEQTDALGCVLDLAPVEVIEPFPVA